MSGKYALIIGNTEYTDPGLAQLTAPGKDAEDFARVLRDQDICRFDKVFTLINRDILTVNQAIEDFFTRKKPDDLLLLYFSGHGVRDENGALYLAVINTNRARLRSTAVRSDFIREAMDQSRSKRQVLILDCCNSGAFARGTKSDTGGSMGTATAFEGTGYGHVVLTATDAIQFAWEGDKVIRGDTTNSLFTHFLVKGLKGEADKDGDGKINVDELYDYAYEQIINTTSKQTPGKWSYRQHGEIILRQSTTIKDVSPQPLPAELNNAIESPLPYVREGAVRQLEEILKGKNARLAQSAREALQRIAAGDDSTRVSTVAKQALQSVSLPIQSVEKIRDPSKRELQKRQKKNAVWVTPAIIGASILFLSLGIIATRTFWLPSFQASIPSPSVTQPGATPANQTEVLRSATLAPTSLSAPTLEQAQPISASATNIALTATEAAPFPTNTEQILIPNTAQKENPVDHATLVYIPPGKFTMGLTQDQYQILHNLCNDPDCEELYNASPEHEVEFTDGYWIYRTEVSNAQFAQCSDCESFQNSFYNENRANYPKTGVTWDQAAHYCGWASDRLPTSAEWEYAARGKAGLLFPWGDGLPDGSQANVWVVEGSQNNVGENPNGYTTPVENYADYASPFGVLNMTGNVWEWVDDWYNINTNEKMGRGGSSWIRSVLSSPAVVDKWGKDNYGEGVGFRCVVVEK